MDPVNNLSDPPAKSSGLAANILASLTASFGSGHLAQGLFANFLSQMPAPLPAQHMPANAQAGSSSSGATQQQSSQQDAAQQGADDKAGTNTPVINTRGTSHSWSPADKSSRHGGKVETDRSDKSNDASDNQVALPSTPPPVPAAAAKAATGKDTTPPPAASATAVDPHNNPDANNDSGEASVLAADLSQGINAQAAVAPAPVSPSADISSASNSATDDNTAADNNPAPSQLMLLPMQLERMAAKQPSAMPSTPGSDSQTTGLQDINAAINQSAPVAAKDAPGKIDIKSLLAQLAGQNNVNGSDDNAIAETDSSGIGSNIENAASVSGAAVGSLPNAPSNSKAASPSTSTDNWMNASFLNLFNIPADNQNTAGVPFATNFGIAAGLAAAGNEDTALDADAQGQNGANTRDAAAKASGIDSNLLSTAGTSQAAKPYDFASQLSALRAAKGGTTGLPTPIEQVVLQLSRGLSKDGSSQMTIQLRPAELGRVEVRLHIDGDGKVQGTVTADNSTTLGLLIKDARSLERSLQEAGLRADPGSLQFNLRGDGQGGSFGQTPDNQTGLANNVSASPGSASLIGVTDPTETYYLTPGGVNMRV